jgi:hypothetical protein
MTKKSRAVLIATLLLSPTVAALAETVTCPNVAYDAFGQRRWTLEDTRVKVTGSISLFGWDIVEGHITLVATYVADDGTRRTVDCRSISH